MPAVLTIYRATRTAAVILNAPSGHRMCWLRVKKLNRSGQQEKTT